ncbi:FAD-dependent oxidoreductase [Paenibacillus sp. OAS669]|uniref:FAD-dependent oxidoreductase n=1 Tax=Paenibacillus sp. OAS669 TaxID=2663821 RepID=UPI00178A40C1|nr:FAD dependent oxidoreductase [Paenibacillus sp. OAS669]MBE1442284.1 2-polyprenyl-6-methoxyphenol hydroxylase-like FAD-dependent oxidoreductase [Paenibacillus sp. OAS669]
MKEMQKKGTAVIIGGSIAGLLTARVVSDYYEEVIMVDKDEFPERPGERSGTPQAYHPHRFTMRGKQITARLFPGYEEDLLALGSPSSYNKTVHNMNPYGSMVGKYPRHDVKFSRAALEWVLRERVKQIANVRSLPRHDVLQLMSTADRSQVTGVLVRGRGNQGQEMVLHADMLFDASGRSSKLPAWLTSMGYDVPAADVLKADIGYSTRRYKLPPHLTHLADEWDVIVMAGDPENKTFSGCFSFIEHQVAEVLLYRPGGHYPPTQEEQFNQALAELPSPMLSNILQQLEPLAPPRGFRVPELYRHHYERMTEWPAGLLVLGDAFCIYDPIFGQGMTVAAIEAETLQSCMQRQWSDPQPHFEQTVLQQLQQVIEPAWWLNCANDLQWGGVEYAGSEPLKGIDWGKRYSALFLQYATETKNWELFGLYWAVNTLSVSPAQIMKPELVRTVLQATADGKRLLDELNLRFGDSLEAALEQILPQFSQEVFVPRPLQSEASNQEAS